VDHGPATEWKEEKSQNFKAKLGIWMFALYTPIYFAFVISAVVSPQFMAKDVGKLNVAIVYGFMIIVLAIVQALVYNWICDRREKKDALEEAGGKGK
jgi:uncharacterized membrane protein (DUF485 family)